MRLSPGSDSKELLQEYIHCDFPRTLDMMQAWCWTGPPEDRRPLEDSRRLQNDRFTKSKPNRFNQSKQR